VTCKYHNIIKTLYHPFLSPPKRIALTLCYKPKNFIRFDLLPLRRRRWHRALATHMLNSFPP